MSDGFNQVFLLGNLGADPELKTSEKGSFLKIRLATTRSWVDKENAKQEVTEWHYVTVFGKRGEALSKILHKGDRIHIAGRISSHSYEKDGQKKYVTDIIAEEVTFAGVRSNGAYSKGPSSAQQEMATPF